MMLRIVFLFILTFTVIKTSLGQIRATTESGNKVLLFENGTWQYEEKSLAAEKASSLEAGVVAAATVNVDSSREITTEPSEFFYSVSPRLVKYFGERGGKIRCKLNCSNNLGIVKLHFSWEFPVADGDRYFGFFDEGSKVIFTFYDGRTVELIMGDERTLKRLEKHNYSLITNNSQPLTSSQLVAFTAQPIRKMEVGWRKRPEEYEIIKSRFLMETLPTVF